MIGTFEKKLGSKQGLNAALNNYHRMQYARWKEECREMDSHVGSGKIIGLIGSVPL